MRLGRKTQRLCGFADDKINVDFKWKFVLGMVENVGKGEKAGYSTCIFFFPKCFQKASFPGSLKVRICG